MFAVTIHSYGIAIQNEIGGVVFRNGVMTPIEQDTLRPGGTQLRAATKSNINAEDAEGAEQLK